MSERTIAVTRFFAGSLMTHSFADEGIKRKKKVDRDCFPAFYSVVMKTIQIAEPEQPLPAYFRPKHFPKFAGISRSKGYELLNAGLIRTVKVDGIRLVSLASVNAYFESLETA